MTGSITLPAVQAGNVTIELTSRAPAKIAIPASVAIPAGQISAPFALSILDEPAIDGPKTVVIKASAIGFPAGSATMRVIDNDTNNLSLSLPAVVGQTTRTVQGTLNLSVPPAGTFRATLSSSDPVKAFVASGFTILPGQTSIPFTITIGDAATIDGLELVTITASVSPWGAVSRTMNVTDAPNPNLTLTGLSSVTEGHGFATASVSIPVAFAHHVTVSLHSSNTAAITVPPAVTIPSGALSASFAMTVVDNGVSNFAQNVSITASASGFVTGTLSVQARDNEFVRYEFEEIYRDVVRCVPFEITIKALAADGSILPNFPGATLTLSAAGQAGNLPVSPTILTGFANGVWKGKVILFTFDFPTRLTVIDETGHSATSDVIFLSHGDTDHYAFSAIAPTQRVGAPFSFTITALDVADNVVTDHYHGASLRAEIPQEPVLIGTGPETWSFPMGGAEVARTQVIYLASELGGARRIASLALEAIASRPLKWPLENWTIRMKHTALGSYASGAEWDSTGWTTVFQHSFQRVERDGWIPFLFTTPFDYDGTSNLLIDFTYNGSHPDVGSVCRSSTVSENRSVVFSTDSGFGDPLTWTGSTNPVPQPGNRIPNIKLNVSRQVAMIPIEIPAAFGSLWPFEEGVWSGSVTMLEAASGIQLSIIDSTGRTATSNLFDVSLGAPILNGEPSFTRGISNTISRQGLAGATAYEVQRATDWAFSAPESSGWIAGTDHTFSGLPNDALQFYRVRARFGAAESEWSAVGFSTQDATAPAITLAVAPGQTYTTLPAIILQGTTSDASGLQSVTANGGLANTSDTFNHWNATLPNLSLGQNTVLVVAADRAAPPNTATLLRTITRQMDSDGDRLPDEWEVQHGLEPHDNGSGLGRNGLLGDANGNGIVNMLEYALAGDAVISNGLVQASRQTNPADGYDYLVVTYPRRIGLLDFKCVIETSEDFVVWSAIGGDVHEILPATPNGDGSTETVSVRIRPALGIGGVHRKVARLRIVAN